jgi:hypothetical protein
VLSVGNLHWHEGQSPWSASSVDSPLTHSSSMFPARVALVTHAYPTWSMAVQQTTAQFFGTFGGRSARPASSKEASEPDACFAPRGV